MNLLRVGNAAVLAANQFNPSVAGQHWLVNNGIVSLDDLEPGCVFTDVLVQVNSRAFQLLITPMQCQVVPKCDVSQQGAVVRSKIGDIVRMLPHTPYVALGLNFLWQITGTEEQVRSLSRELFFVESGRLHTFFEEPDARFGGYLSKDFLGFRLKLDVKPALGETEGEQFHALQFGFNFHSDIKQDPVETVIDALLKWDAADSHASMVMNHVITERLL